MTRELLKEAAEALRPFGQITEETESLAIERGWLPLPKDEHFAGWRFTWKVYRKARATLKRIEAALKENDVLQQFTDKQVRLETEFTEAIFSDIEGLYEP